MADPTTTVRTQGEAWLTNRRLFAASAMLALLALALSLAFVQFARQEKASQKRAQMQQIAKAMESQAAVGLDALEASIRVFANSPLTMIDAAAPGRISPVVAGLVRSLPKLRSVSLLNAQGVVLASTNAANLGHAIDLSLFGAWPVDPSRLRIERMLSGRDLIDARRAGATSSQVLPMLIGVPTGSDQQLVLVALVNVDHFSLEFESTIDDPTVKISLTDLGGALLVATSNVPAPAGSSFAALRAFTEFLPRSDWGSYIGAGVADAKAIAAFSTLRKWPMVVLAEASYPQAMAELAPLELGVGLILLAVWLTIAMLAWLVDRSLQRFAAVRQQQDEEIRASETRNNAVLEASFDGVITVDGRGIIVALNAAAEGIFGMARVQCLGRSVDNLFVPASQRQAHRDGRKRYLASGDAPSQLNRRIETVAQRANGDLFPVELSIVATRANGAAFFTANVRDISQSKQRTQELIDLVDRYHHVAADLEQQKLALDQHAIVSIVDAEDNIVYANDKLCEISGYAGHELVGQRLHKFRQPMASEAYAELREHLAAGKIWRGELRIRHRDGSTYWVTNTSVPVHADDGSILQYITIQTDISELRLTQNALKEAHDRELTIGNRIQRSLLTASPALHLQGLWLSHFNQASKGVDGDFIDVIQMGGHCVDLIVGDVMGKGVPAALLGAATKLQFSRCLAELLAQTGQSGDIPQPNMIVQSVHQAMTPHLQALDSFVTLAYIRIDLSHRTITWVGCGHEPPLLMHGDGSTSTLPNQQPPLGVLDGCEYTQSLISMASDDALFLCSDGLYDAIGVDGERLGRELVNATLQRLAREHATPAAALQSLRSQLINTATQLTDDVTMALIMQPASGVNASRCELTPELKSIRQLRSLVGQQAQQAGLNEQDVALIEVASVEVFTNIVRHAQGLLLDAPVELITRTTAQDFEVDLVYLGQAYAPPELLNEPDMDSFPEGGFGLTIIRNACDRVQYLHHLGVNTVHMARRLQR